MGMTRLRQTSPSAIWMFWISVASRAVLPLSGWRTVSDRTSWSSMDLTLAWDSSTTNSPVNGRLMGQDWRWSLPETLKPGSYTHLTLPTILRV